jgi:uncharacterized iron-regulated membrane protein
MRVKGTEFESLGFSFELPRSLMGIRGAVRWGDMKNIFALKCLIFLLLLILIFTFLDTFLACYI